MLLEQSFWKRLYKLGSTSHPPGSMNFESMHSTKSMRRYKSRGSIYPDDATEFSINFLMGLAPRLRTPRMAKRYGNALQFSLGILQGEIRYIDLMMIEGIRTLYPQFYLQSGITKRFSSRARDGGIASSTSKSLFERTIPLLIKMKREV